MPDIKSAPFDKIDKQKTILIDLDDTVYPASSGVSPAIQERIERYMLERLKDPSARRSFHAQRSLPQIRHNPARLANYPPHRRPGVFIFRPRCARLQFVDPRSGSARGAFKNPQPKFIFTNADRHHARRVLEVLKLIDCFDGMFDSLDIAPYCKPMPEGFQIAMKLAKVANPQDCIFIDDGIHNLAGARKLGIFTIHVGAEVSADQCDASIQSLVQLPALLQTLSAHRP